MELKLEMSQGLLDTETLCLQQDKLIGKTWLNELYSELSELYDQLQDLRVCIPSSLRMANDYAVLEVEILLLLGCFQKLAVLVLQILLTVFLCDSGLELSSIQCTHLLNCRNIDNAIELTCKTAYSLFKTIYIDLDFNQESI